ncbi:hypothetical protein AXK58_13825 [Tsukamurella tyrosinosolvens]|nr:hypothetical protein AXK58_13825 [Tsukamurella tyrosinosolvens]
MLNTPLAYALTTVAMFGALGMLLGSLGWDYVRASLLLQVSAELLAAVAIGYGVPTGFWAARADRRRQLPPARYWAAPLVTVGVLLPLSVAPLMLPMTPVFVVCLGFTVAGIVIIRFRTASDRSTPSTREAKEETR